MANKKDIINELIREVYTKTYITEYKIECSIEDLNFKYYIGKDWRFLGLYYTYIEQHDRIGIDEFISKELNNLQKFVYEVLLDIPEGAKPEHLYLEDTYPFRFEIYKQGTPNYEEFTQNIWRIHFNVIAKQFYELTNDEIYDKLIRYLKDRIAKINERRKKRIDNDKKERKIYKYDKNGELIRIYNSRKECCEDNNITKAAMSMHLKGKRKALKGFIYKEFEQNNSSEKC